MAKVSCCRKFPGRSLRGVRPESPVPGFSLLFVICVVPLWCQSGVPPEGPRSLRGTGVSGPCDRSLRPVKASSTSLRPGAESPPCTGVSGPPDRSLRPSTLCAPCGASLVSVRRLPGRCPESPGLHRSIRPLRPESPVQVVPNGQKSWRGINTPPPLSEQPARPAFMNPNF